MQSQENTTLLDIIKAEGPINKINPAKQKSHKIGYNYARKFLATKEDFLNDEITYKRKTFTQHVEDYKSLCDDTDIIINFKKNLVQKFIKDTPQSRLKKNTRRWRTYQVFKSLIDSYDHSKYSKGEHAVKLPTECENFSKSPVPNTRTTLCSLIGRILVLVNQVHVQDMIYESDKTMKIRKKQKRIANDKKTIKTNKMIDRYGESGFNRLKQVQKAASNIRKAKEVTGDVKKELKFVEWRKSVVGMSYDKPFRTGLLKTVPPIYKYENNYTDLGSTDFKGMSEMVRKYISKGRGLKIEFDVQRDDATTTLYQHVYLRDQGVLSLKNVQHFNSDGVVFTINNYYLDTTYDTLYANLDNKSVTCNRLLPKEWGHFENWVGYGIVGNPKHSTICEILVKILPTNIKMFHFTYDGETYRINHTRNSRNVQTLAQIEAKMQNKYENAHDKLQKAVKEKREQDSKKAREKSRESRTPGYDKAMNDIYNKNFVGERSTLEELTELLSNGKISAETYKKAANALN